MKFSRRITPCLVRARDLKEFIDLVILYAGPEVEDLFVELKVPNV